MEAGFIDTDYPPDACKHPPSNIWMDPDDHSGSSDADLAATGGAAAEASAIEVPSAEGAEEEQETAATNLSVREFFPPEYFYPLSASFEWVPPPLPPSGQTCLLTVKFWPVKPIA